MNQLGFHGMSQRFQRCSNGSHLLVGFHVKFRGVCITIYLGAGLKKNDFHPSLGEESFSPMFFKSVVKSHGLEIFKVLEQRSYCHRK